MSDSRISRKAVTLVVILFVLGIGLGAVGEHLWSAHVIASQRGMHPVQELKEDLQLSADQARQFDAIIADERANFHTLDSQEHSEWDPKWDQVRQQGRDRIRAILTPEQAAKFEAFVKKLDEERRKRQQQR